MQSVFNVKLLLEVWGFFVVVFSRFAWRCCKCYLVSVFHLSELIGPISINTNDSACTHLQQDMALWLWCEVNTAHFSLSASRNDFAAFQYFFNSTAVLFWGGRNLVYWSRHFWSQLDPERTEWFKLQTPIILLKKQTNKEDHKIRLLLSKFWFLTSFIVLHYISVHLIYTAFYCCFLLCPSMVKFIIFLALPVTACCKPDG